MGRSTLDDFGEEITGIAAPVSLCMAITVFLVRVLNPSGASDSQSVFIASIAYDEKAGDSSGTKFGGALLNALIFVGVVGAMTFILFLLFKYGCIKVIYAYMGFAVFNIFFFITGTIVIQLLTIARIHVDMVSLVFMLLNFSVVGMLGLFFIPIPLFMKQAYLVWVGVMVAYIFTFIPEWTAWILLVAMALYDLAAVLCPGGPLKILVELAIERQQELPALVYEARPTRGPYQRGLWARRENGQGGPVAEGSRGADAEGNVAQAVGPLVLEMHRLEAEQVEREQQREEQRAQHPQQLSPNSWRLRQLKSTRADGSTGPVGEATERDPGSEDEAASSIRGSHRSLATLDVRTSPGGGAGADTPESARSTSPLMSGPLAPHPLQVQTRSSASLQPGQQQQQPGLRSAAADPGAGGLHPQEHQSGTPRSSDDDVDLPDAIKLGLGDFIFYSMLVGRAAMYDMMTVFSSYLAIMAGLGLTLLLLAVSKRALPALPFSIALGVAFYFLTRLTLEPFLVPLAARNLYF